ncbi:hypothetical protein [Priestia filamentosa]|uniref:hypothetical protein n=1 Tax=Priestia filamentosa TaxID=1402861 RepID=UPI003D28338B
MNLALLATEMSNIYKRNPKIEGVLLGGSVSRNWHDEFSDEGIFQLIRIEYRDLDLSNMMNKIKSLRPKNNSI